MKEETRTWLHEIPREYVHRLWPKIEPLIEKVDPYSNGEGSTEQGKVYLIEGLATGFILAGSDMEPKGVIVGEWKTTPNKRIFLISALGGSHALTPESYEQIEEWVRKHGGTHIQGACRESIARLMRKRWGYKPAYTVVEKEI